ncbi:tripartite tricarboxylate transporter TctB family protein [Enteractinococcus coprophilus]|uniref:Tripartite tricarboxylate transporter TctB family protein n=1 Tax=Enteractinococcus coprophilus TaxID=1027633 RepID=A0A543ANH9_9MICC|nr:tripartite tricarboxylate transporter TctB family protein [Enteractinococcus coprophilus]TQL74105.1 tripartite tricarboxylate transporter TctB family protein [Enteractinococcus coprophilus]
MTHQQQPESTPLQTPQVEQRSATTAWRVAGVLGLLVSAVVAWVSWTNYELGTLDRPGPGFFPLLVAGLLAIASVIALVEARGATFGYEPIAWRRFGLAAAVILGGAVTLPIFGFLPVALVGTIALAIMIEGKFHWKIPVTMTAIVFGIWFVFERLLGIGLP